jgi:hypothetical protein
MKKLGILISLLVLSSGCATARHYGAYFHTQWKIMYHTLNNTPQTCTAIDPSLPEVKHESHLSLKEQIAQGKKEVEEWQKRQEPAPIFNLDEVNEKLFEEVKEVETKILASLRQKYEEYGDLATTDVPILTEPEEPEPVHTGTQGALEPVADEPEKPEPVIPQGTQESEEEPIALLDLIPEERKEELDKTSPDVQEKDTRVYAEDGSFCGEICKETKLPKTVFVAGYNRDGQHIDSSFVVSPQEIERWHEMNAAWFAVKCFIAVQIVCILAAIGCIFYFIIKAKKYIESVKRDTS